MIFPGRDTKLINSIEQDRRDIQDRTLSLRSETARDTHGMQEKGQHYAFQVNLQCLSYLFFGRSKEHSLEMRLEASSCPPPVGFPCCHPFKQESLRRKPISRLPWVCWGCSSPTLHISHSFCARAQGGSQMDQPTLLYPLIWLISRMVIMLQRNEGQWVGGEGSDLLAMQWQSWYFFMKEGGQEEELEGGQ